jgi:hypothetical protein
MSRVQHGNGIGSDIADLAIPLSLILALQFVKQPSAKNIKSKKNVKKLKGGSTDHCVLCSASGGSLADSFSSLTDNIRYMIQ